MKQLIAVGLSGGIDSAVTAALLKERGENLIGVMMSLGRADEAKTIEEARQIADRLDIPFYVVDLSNEWRREVIDYIRTSYLKGLTPNPCVQCNERVKFSLLPRYAFERLGAKLFATGHYARYENGKLLRGVDRTKDQSYFLYRVEPTILERTLFPLGAMTKAEVRALAHERGLILTERGESQDLCGGEVCAILDAKDCEGEIVTVEGKVIGRHRGFWHYTVGMRKGLGVGGGIPYYVVALDAKRNRVIVGYKAVAEVKEFRIQSLVNGVALAGEALGVKVRSAGEPKGMVTVELEGEDSAIVRAEFGLFGVAPGQSAVFYSGDTILGGGIILDCPVHQV